MNMSNHHRNDYLRPFISVLLWALLFGGCAKLLIWLGSLLISNI